MKDSASTMRDHRLRIAGIVALLAIAVFGVYRYAGAQNAGAQAVAAASGSNGAGAQAVSASGGAGGGGCCGGGAASSTSGASSGSGGIPGSAATVASAAGPGSVTRSGSAPLSGGCCGGGSSTPVEGTAKRTGDVQIISVDLSSGGYNPNVIKLKAGLPTEITFGQSAGCTGSVQSQDLGFQADLTAGPQTVKLPALTAGTYRFACGMGMVTGQIVVS